MARSGRTPEGYYSASHTLRKLNVGSSTLDHFVETGKIRRIVQPGMRTGYYLQEDVDTMAREREIFFQTFHEGQIFMSTQEGKPPTSPEQDSSTISERLDRIEKQLDEHKVLLSQILERLSQNP